MNSISRKRYHLYMSPMHTTVAHLYSTYPSCAYDRSFFFVPYITIHSFQFRGRREFGREPTNFAPSTPRCAQYTETPSAALCTRSTTSRDHVVVPRRSLLQGCVDGFKLIQTALHLGILTCFWGPSRPPSRGAERAPRGVSMQWPGSKDTTSAKAQAFLQPIGYVFRKGSRSARKENEDRGLYYAALVLSSLRRPPLGSEKTEIFQYSVETFDEYYAPYRVSMHTGVATRAR